MRRENLNRLKVFQKFSPFYYFMIFFYQILGFTRKKMRRERRVVPSFILRSRESKEDGIWEIAQSLRSLLRWKSVTRIAVSR
jgi:hypothetical protein